jgi:uncharacterized membrane protein HdeD (DUF308 family)
MMTDTMSHAPTADTTRQLYLTRAVVAIAWAVLLVVALASSRSLSPQESVPGLAIALLIIYPLIDVVASLVDARSQRRQGAARNATIQLVNAVISSVVAVVIAVVASHGADAVLRTFGAWATLTGLIQLTLGVIRHRRATSGQWPMIISGAISTLAGFSFAQMSTQDDLKLSSLAGYATLGAIFFLLSAWRLGSGRVAAATSSPSAGV